MMELQQVAALSLFLVVTILSSSRLVHRAAVSLVGALIAAAVWGFSSIAGTLFPEVLLVTAGLMVLTGFVKKSGIASWLALKAAKGGNGRPKRILVLTGVLTFLVGALLGPVAAVALVLPVALLLAVELDVSPLPFVVVLPWTALLGGATVLTAQPGNLWVAAALGLDGSSWAVQMVPYTAAALVATLATGVLVFGNRLRVTHERRARVLEFDEAQTLGDRPLLFKTLTVLTLVVLGLVLGPWINLAPSLVAVGGAVVLWLWDSPRSTERFLADIDGGSLLFLGGMMAVAGVLTVSGLLAGGLPVLDSPVLVLWSAALLGAFVDHGVVAGTLAPVAMRLWPFLILGSSLGAGITVLGASSNAVAQGFTGQGPRRVTWQEFTRFGLLFASVNLVVVTALTFALD